MSELLKNTEKLVEQFNQSIRDDLSFKNIDDTGEAASSMRIEVNENKNSVTSYGIFYMYYLDKGRGPGKFPPVNVITDWAVNKPVEISPYLIGRKIAREGTEIFKNSSKGIELDNKRKELLNKLKQESPKWAKQDLLVKMKGINKI